MNGFDLIIKPDEEDVDAAEVLVDGTIGDSPYRFLLDTGPRQAALPLTITPPHLIASRRETHQEFLQQAPWS